MFYTRRGDDGSTGTFGCDQRLSKSSSVAEALGAVDEINSLLGWCKVKVEAETAELLELVQQNLFIVQAELAGVKQTVAETALRQMEDVIDKIEQSLPPIKTFLVAGGTEISALLDYARTVARRAERRVVSVLPEQPVGRWTLGYLNRLSSLLYALARLANHKSGIKEQPPHY